MAPPQKLDDSPRSGHEILGGTSALVGPSEGDLAPEEYDHVERLLADFERNWTPEQFADALARLPAAGHPLRTTALLGLLRVEIERQTAQGSPPTLETYLARCPELGTPDTVAVSLILHEYRARQRFGPPPDLSDFAGRFPRQADELRRLVASNGQNPVKSPVNSTPPAPASGVALTSPRLSSSAAEAERSDSICDERKPDDGPVLPEKFDRYTIVKKLGQGGMGAVYLALDSKLNRHVALKVPKFSPGNDSENLERFYREARATATIHHPNLCPLYDVGEWNGVPYLTMAYIEGWSLSTFIRPDKPLPQAGVASLVRTIALAVYEAHKHGIIHRDLKPGNILVDKRGQPIVMDFGLARWVSNDKEDVRLTRNGTILGAPVYMSPEQVYGDVENMGPPCDIYSTGVILYELLTARLPFEGPTTAILAKTLIQAPTPPSQHRPDIDPRLEAICLKAMAKQITDRFATMKDMATALSDYIKADKQERTAAKAASGSVSDGDASGIGSGVGLDMPSGAAIYSTAGTSGRTTTTQSTGRQTLVAPLSSASRAPSVPPREDALAPSAREIARQLDGDDPSMSMVARISPQVKPTLSQIRQRRTKFWVISLSIFALLAAGGGLLAWKLWPRPPIGIIQIRLIPVGAEVTVEIDDRIVDRNLLDAKTLTPGTHKLLVKGEKYENYTQEFTVAEGDNNPPLDVELKAKPVIVPPVVPQPPVVIPTPSAPLQEPFVGHTRPVRALAVSTNGKLAVSGADDGKLHLWDVPAHKLIRTFSGHTAPVLALALSLDGKQIVSSGLDYALRLWDVDSGKELPLHDSIEPMLKARILVRKLVVLPSGRRYVAGTEDGRLLLFDFANPQQVLFAEWPTVPAPVGALAVSPDGSRLAVGNATSISLLGLTPVRPLTEIKLQTGVVNALAFSADGGLLVSGGEDGAVRVWNGQTGTAIHTFSGHAGAVHGVAFAQNNARIVSVASGPFDNTVRLWELTTLRFIGIVGRHKDGVNALATVPNGALVLTGSDDSTLRLWDLGKLVGDSPLPTADQLVEVRRFLTVPGRAAGAERVAVTRDGRRALTAGLDGVGHVWDVATGREVLALKGHDGALHGVDFSPDGKRAVTCGEDGTVRVWNAETGALLLTFDKHTQPVWSAVFAPDGQMILSAGGDKLALLWKAETGDIFRRFDKHTDIVSGAAFSPDGKRVVTVSWDRTVRHWQIDIGEQLHVFDNLNLGPLFAVAFHPDGNQVVVGGAGRAAVFLDLAGKKEIRRLEGHTSSVPSLAVSPVGRYLLTAGPDRDVCQWEWASGKLLTRYNGAADAVGGLAYLPLGGQALVAGKDRTVRLLEVPRLTLDPVPSRLTTPPVTRALVGHTGAVLSVAFTPDGKRALTGGVDKLVRLWDVGPGKSLAAFGDPADKETAGQGHTDTVRAVAVSGDGKRALSAGYDKVVRHWDLDNRKLLSTFTGHLDKVECVAFSADGKRAVSGGDDKLVLVWEIEKGILQQRFEGHTAAIRAVVFAPDGKHVYSASVDKTIRRLDPAGKEKPLVWSAPAEVASLAITRDGRRLASGGKDNAVSLWDAGDGRLLARFRGHDKAIGAVAFTVDGRFLLGGGEDHTARLWDVETGQEVGRLDTKSPIFSVAIDKDSRTALLGCGDRTVRVWTLPDTVTKEPGPQKFTTKDMPKLDRLAISADGRLALLAGQDKTARLWDLATNKELRRLLGHDGEVKCVAFAPDSQRACTAATDGSVRTWTVSAGQPLLRIDAHPGGIAWSAVFSPDGKQILSGGHSGKAFLWNAENGEKIATFDHRNDKLINGVAMSPDGRFVLTASHDQTAIVWNPANGVLLRKLAGHKGEVNAVASSPDGRFVLTGANDKTAKLWLTETGECLHTFGPYNDAVWTVAFSPDGRLVALGSKDKSVRLFETFTGRGVRVFSGNAAHTDGVTGVVFLPDGKRLASVALDKTLRLWPVPPR